MTGQWDMTEHWEERDGGSRWSGGNPRPARHDDHELPHPSEAPHGNSKSGQAPCQSLVGGGLLSLLGKPVRSEGQIGACFYDTTPMESGRRESNPPLKLGKLPFYR